MEKSVPVYKTKEYYRQKMRESRSRGKGQNPKTLYYITIDNKEYVVDRKSLNPIKTNKINTLNNPIILTS